MKHRVAVTVSEPDHPAVSMRKEQKQKFVRVTAESQDEAITKAKAHYKKQGYKVHGAEYHSEIKEEVEQIDEISKKTLGSYIKKASKDASGRATAAMHTKNIAKDLRKVGAHDMADTYDDESFKATEKQIKRQQGIAKATDRLTKEELELDESDRIPSAYQKDDAKGTYHIEYHGTDKDGNKSSKLYKLKANDRHHAQFKALKIGASEHPQHVRSSTTTHKFVKEESGVEEGYVSDAQRKAVWAARNDEKEAKKKKIKEAINKLREDVAELENDLEDLQEASFSYCVKKAEEAKSKGNNKRFEYHMENARTARLGMTGKEMIRNRQHLDKYNELRNGK